MDGSRQPDQWSLSRRGILQGAGLTLFGIGSVAALKLPFFAVDPAQVEAGACVGDDLSAEQMELIISNWPGYIDPMKKPTSTVSVFQDRTGITVDYTDDVNDNSEFYAKVKNQLGACEPINRDMMMLTDWMAARMIGLGWIQPLDKAKVPNLHANLIEPLRNRQWDPDLEFHAPWQSGLTGIAYNAAKTGEVKSFEELLTRSDLKGRITLLSEMRDTMGFMLKVQRRRPERLHRGRVEGRDRPAQGQSCRPARSARSPATSTSRTSPPATSSPARRGPAT